MSGLSSYPRSGAGGLNPAIMLTLLFSDLSKASTAKAGNLIAAQLMTQLHAYCKGNAAAPDKIDFCRSARDSLFKASQKGVLHGFPFFEAMELGAHWFRQAFPFDMIVGTGNDKKAYDKCAKELADPNTTATPQGKRIASEAVGSISARYQMCALAGIDLYATHFDSAALLPGANYSVTQANKRILYASCAGPYNVNEILVLDIPGCDPIIIVAEAKGGKSDYGHAKPHKNQVKRNALQPGATTSTLISQTEWAYAVSRAQFMASAQNDKGNGVQNLRKKVGKLILDAAANDRLLYITARGQVKVISTNPFQSDLASEREHIKWA